MLSINQVTMQIDFFHTINRFIARLGEYDLSPENHYYAQSIDVKIDRKIIHEKYVPDSISNDIGLLQLRTAINVNGNVKCTQSIRIYLIYHFFGAFIFLHLDRIRPICLPLFEPLRTQDLTGYNSFVAGWGSTIYQGPQSSILLDAQVPIVSLTDCARSYNTLFPSQPFDERVICAGYGGSDTCQGDSGGPLMLPQVSA